MKVVCKTQIARSEDLWLVSDSSESWDFLVPDSVYIVYCVVFSRTGLISYIVNDYFDPIPSSCFYEPIGVLPAALSLTEFEFSDGQKIAILGPTLFKEKSFLNSFRGLRTREVELWENYMRYVEEWEVLSDPLEAARLTKLR